ncbi:MAG: ABC transporter ATP-binding protein [Turneriella sp.]|nr:ABC transporter ATP-binding protein [Leptospiraceae bacterium]MCX7632800.1 ABC transporter ATP-binding protein [Turneriella sp.]
MQPLLAVRELHKSYHDGEIRAEVLKGISFTVNAGEFVAIQGPSGAGKSTLLNLLGALDKPDSGTIEVDGRTITSAITEQEIDLFRRDKVGFVFQNHYLLQEFTVLENVMLPLRVQGIPKEQAMAAAAEILNRVGLGHRLQHLPSQISGGESQRAAFARAVVKKPALILADEPTGNLDSENRAKFIEVLSALQEQDQLTVIVVTHEQELAQAASRRLHLRDGQLG